jgi:RES domain
MRKDWSVSSSIWTLRAVASEARRATRRLWRAVEAQHVASTVRLVANAEEQIVLERILEDSKPPLPPGSAGLHYLLATPFRYAAPIGSRFRAPTDAGVWYGAEKERTACAELGFWRWRFLMHSPALSGLGPAPQTVFRAGIEALMVDLTQPPFKRARAQWRDAHSYAATQAFAHTARAAAIDAVRYESVRDPQHGAAVALFNPKCFKPRRLLEQHTWFLTVRREAAIWQREGESIEFDAAGWTA